MLGQDIFSDDFWLSYCMHISFYRTWLVTGVFLILIINLSAQPSFETRIGGADTQRGEEFLQTQDGGLLIVGHSTAPGRNDLDLFLVRTDDAGAIQWTRYIGGPGQDFGYAIQPCPTGGYLLAGEYEQNGSPDAWLVRINANGDTLWTRKMGGIARDGFQTLIPTSDGNFVAAGYTRSNIPGKESLLLAKINDQGQWLWSQTHGNAGFWRGNQLLENPDGTLVIAGNEADPGLLDRNALLIKTDSQGNLIWAFDYDFGDEDYALDLGQTADGGYVLLGSSVYIYPFYADMTLLKVDAGGTFQWQQKYGGTDYETGIGLEVLSDGTMVLVGSSTSEGQHWFDNDIFLLRVDAMGDTLWSRRFGKEEADFGKAVQMTPDGGFVICGSATDPASFNVDLYLIKTDALGMTTSQEYPETTPEIHLFPNPAQDQIFLSAPVDQFILLDLTGRKILHLAPTGQTVDLSQVAPGLYMAEVISKHQSFFQKLIIK